MTDRRLPLVALIALLLVVPARGNAQSEYEPQPQLPVGSVLLTLPSSHMAREGTWEVGFMHRFLLPVDEGSLEEQLRSLWGLDGGANVGISASWVARRDLELSLARTNTLDVFELAARYVLVQQAPAVPATVALRGGVDLRTEHDLSDRVSWFAQGIISRQFGRRTELFIIPTFTTDAGRVTDGRQSAALFSEAANVALGGVVMIGTNLSLVAEVIPANRDLPEGSSGDPAWSLGLKRALGGHHFEVILTNSLALTVDEYTTSTFVGSSLDAGELHLGFNIRRSFGSRSR